MTRLQMNFGTDYGKTICLEDRTLVEHLNVAGDAQREGDFKRADEILRQVITDRPLTELPVDTLCPLTTRTLNVLRNNNITTVADLVQRRLSDLRNWNNFGKASRSYLGERLRTFGLNLVDQHDHKWTTPPVNRRPTRLDLLLVLPIFQLDRGYNQDHVLRALNSIAYVAPSPHLALALAPGGLGGLNLICNRTDLDAMTVWRLVRDLAAKKLVDEPTPGKFSISPSGLRLLRQGA